MWGEGKTLEGAQLPRFNDFRSPRSYPFQPFPANSLVSLPLPHFPPLDQIFLYHAGNKAAILSH